MKKQNFTLKNCLSFSIISSFCLLLFSQSVLMAAGPTKILLWPNGAPGAKGDADGDKPSLTIYLPDSGNATGTAVVICPGGGYGHLAMDHEGHQVARWLNSFGVAGFILQYRHSGSGEGYRHPYPLMDAQRALSTVRARAAEWNVDPSRIGILGFSAGGHLCSTAATHYHKGNEAAADPIDRVNCRPDFHVLVYPVINLQKEWFTHMGSCYNLLGKPPKLEDVLTLSNHLMVTPDTPPAFLIGTYEDTGVPCENSIYYYLALRKAKVPSELHVYQKGGHGFGLGKPEQVGATAEWPNQCKNWMAGLGLLEKSKEIK